MKTFLKNTVPPIQILALLVIPILLVVILNVTIASAFSIVSQFTFIEVLHSSGLAALDLFMGLMFAIATGQMMWGDD